jgi:hypothetical protein
MAFWTKFHSTRSDIVSLLFVPCSLPELGHCLTIISRSKTWSSWLPAWWPSARNPPNLGSRWGTTATSTRRVLGKNLSLGISTVETNRDRDQLLKLVEIILTVETRLFFFSVEIFKIETFQSRFSCVKIFEICQDFSRFIEISRDLLFASVKIESLDRDHVETNRDPQAYKNQDFFPIWHHLLQ